MISFNNIFRLFVFRWSFVICCLIKELIFLFVVFSVLMVFFRGLIFFCSVKINKLIFGYLVLIVNELKFYLLEYNG